MKQFTAFQRERQGGFSLIEMIIGAGLFSLLMLLIVSSFFYLVNVQRTLESKQQVLNDFRLAVDVMVKEMTSGSAFPTGCENGCQSLIFVSKPRPDMPQRNIEYRLVGTRIEKAEQKTYGVCSTIPFDSNCFQPFHSDNVQISELNFYVQNRSVAFTQPAVSIDIEGTIHPGKREAESFQISSSVTPRLLQDPAALPPTDNVFPVVTITNPPNSGTYTTGAATLSLSGVSSDNVGVVVTNWRNETTGQSGIAGGSPTSWSVPNIPLLTGSVNTLVVESTDAAGNAGLATLVVTSTAAPPPPPTPVANAYQTCGNGIYVDGGCQSGVTRLYIYRCNGICTPVGTGTGGDYRGDVPNCTPDFFDSTVTEGSQYTYGVKSYNSSTGLYSPMSNLDPITVSTFTACAAPPPPCTTGGWVSGSCGVGACQSYQREQTRSVNPAGCAVTSQCVNDLACGVPPVQPQFSLAPVPSIIRVRVGGSSTVFRQSQDTDIRVIPINGFTENVTFALISGAPLGTIPYFTPTIVNSGGYSPGTNFKVNVQDNTPIGVYSLVVRGTGQSGFSTTTRVILDVAATGGGQQ